MIPCFVLSGVHYSRLPHNLYHFFKYYFIVPWGEPHYGLSILQWWEGFLQGPCPDLCHSWDKPIPCCHGQKLWVPGRYEEIDAQKLIKNYSKVNYWCKLIKVEEQAPLHRPNYPPHCDRNPCHTIIYTSGWDPCYACVFDWVFFFLVYLKVGKNSRCM